MCTRPFSALLAAILVGGLGASPGYAARARVFVASYGTDSGNTTCSFTQPCRTFQNAVNNVAAGGEVTAIDSAGFGPVSITQSVTITGPSGVEAGITAISGADGIDINAPGGVVKVSGLTLVGANNGDNGSYGILLTAAARLEVIDCNISGFTFDGIAVLSANSVVISNSIITDSGNGVGVFNDGPGNGAIAVTIDHLLVSSVSYGIYADESVGPVQVLMIDSRIDGAATGMLGNNQLPSQSISIILQNVTLSQTPNAGLYAIGNTSYWLSRVTQTSVTGFTDPAIVFSGTGSHAYSDGTNHLMGSGTNLLSSWTTN